MAGVADRSPHVLPRLRCNCGPIATALFRVRVAEARTRIDLREMALADATCHEERVETKAMRPDEAVALPFPEPAHVFDGRPALAVRRPHELPRARNHDRSAGAKHVVRLTDSHPRYEHPDGFP